MYVFYSFRECHYLKRTKIEINLKIRIVHLVCCREPWWSAVLDQARTSQPPPLPLPTGLGSTTEPHQTMKHQNIADYWGFEATSFKEQQEFENAK